MKMFQQGTYLGYESANISFPVINYVIKKLLNAGIYPCDRQNCDIYQTENLIGCFWLMVSGSWQSPDHLFLFCIGLHFYLQLFLIKGFEQVLRNDLVEALLQGQELSLDAVQETPVYVQPAGGTRARRRNQATNSHKPGTSFLGLRLTLRTWHTPSWCPLTPKLSFRSVWARVGWFLRKHCAPHRKCDPGRRWCHCPWRGRGDKESLSAQFVSMELFEYCYFYIKQECFMSLFFFFCQLRWELNLMERMKWYAVPFTGSRGQ